jgi:hypothetical protein
MFTSPLCMFPSLYADLDSSTFNSYAGILLKLPRTHGTPLLFVAAYGTCYLLSALVLRRHHPLIAALSDSLFSADFLIDASPLSSVPSCSFGLPVSNGLFIVTSCCSLKCTVYFVTKQLYSVLFLIENKRENKEAASHIKQHWLVTHTSLTRLTSSDMDLISWRQANQPEQPDQPDGTW